MTNLQQKNENVKGGLSHVFMLFFSDITILTKILVTTYNVCRPLTFLFTYFFRIYQIFGRLIKEKFGEKILLQENTSCAPRISWRVRSPVSIRVSSFLYELHHVCCVLVATDWINIPPLLGEQAVAVMLHQSILNILAYQYIRVSNISDDQTT